MLSQSGATANAYLYTGQQYDALTGLYYLRARYYEPASGRFLSRDTFGYNFRNPIQLNRYVYGAGNPINSIDPLGLQAFAEYSVNEGKTEAENAAVEPVGEEFASEAEELVDETEMLIRNAGYPGEDAINFLQIKGSPASGEWSEYVPKEYLDRVWGAFKGEPQAITLDEDLSVYRYWSDVDAQIGHWLTLNPNLSPAEARALLALPNENLATNVTQFVIPKGSTVLIGTVAEQTTTPGFGAYAIGGGFQIYVPDIDILLNVPLLSP